MRDTLAKILSREKKMKVTEGVHIIIREGAIKAYRYTSEGKPITVPFSEISYVTEATVDKLDSEVYEQLKEFKIKDLQILQSLIEVSDIRDLAVEKISNHSCMGHTFNEGIKVPGDIKLPRGIKLSNPIIYIPDNFIADRVEVTDVNVFKADAETLSRLTGDKEVSIEVTSGEIKPETLSGFKQIKALSFEKGVTFLRDNFSCPACKVLYFNESAPFSLIFQSLPKEVSFRGKVSDYIIATSGVIEQVSIDILKEKEVQLFKDLNIGSLLVNNIEALDISRLKVKYIGSGLPGQKVISLLEIPVDLKIAEGTVIGNYKVR